MIAGLDIHTDLLSLAANQVSEPLCVSRNNLLYW